MGAKCWLLAYSPGNAADLLREKPPLDPAATDALLARLFPGDVHEARGRVDLLEALPRSGERCAGVFGDVALVMDDAFALDNLSRLDRGLIDAGGAGRVTAICMHSVVDWAAVAVWENGTLRRALSLSPDAGIIEDVGERMDFEAPYWAGEHPAIDPEDEDPDEPGYPFPFHPLDLGEAALASLIGYQIEGVVGAAPLDFGDVELVDYVVSAAKKPWWKIW